MTRYRNEYGRWLQFADKATVEELKSLEGQEEQLEYRFSKNLDFGTAGLRGVMMAGLNAMNVYTVGAATKGLAEYIKDLGAADRGVLIGCDSRIHSAEFSKVAAEVLTANGIKVYIFDELRPTPMVSYGTRAFHCIAGINITASHNPKEYNGYKVYFEDGAQISPDQATIISDYIRKTDVFSVERDNFDLAVSEGRITVVGKDFDEQYLSKVLAQRVDSSVVPAMAKRLKVVYSPFHGAGYRLVPEILRCSGLEQLFIVQEQALPDGSFPTVKSPNPENPEGFSLGIELAKKVESDLIIATDPDCDRVGVMAKNAKGQFETISGNCMGCLLLDYILSAHSENGTMPPDPYAVKTIVSTDLAEEICRCFGVKLYEVLTGFKYIGEVIKRHEDSGKGSFILGFEESYGYLKGTYARDKDAVVASMLITEMAAYYKEKDMTLIDARTAMYEKYGYFAEKTENFQIAGLDALEKMQNIMKNIRESHPKELGGMRIVRIGDYLTGIAEDPRSERIEPTGLPSSNVLSFTTDAGCKVLVRPSGTEPKIKIYLLCRGTDAAEANARLAACAETVRSWI